MRRWITSGLTAIVWVWTLYTVYTVARWGGAVLIDPSTTSRVMAVRGETHIDSAIGLTYHGMAGALLVLIELALVVGALVMSLSRQAFNKRLGAIILLAWTLLWLGNSIWMERLADGNHPTHTTLVILATGAVLLWSAMSWATGSRGSRAPGVS